MANFNNDVGVDPSYPLTEVTSIAVRKVQFGDGYQMVVQDGLNQDLKKYNAIWTNITLAEKNLIQNFLEARKGIEAFEWTPPNHSAVKKYRCQNWSHNLVYANIYTLKAEWEEVAIP